MNIFGFAMAVLYVGLGIFLLVANNIFGFSGFQQLGFGLILILYGLVRFYSAIKKKRESESEEDDEE